MISFTMLTVQISQCEIESIDKLRATIRQLLVDHLTLGEFGSIEVDVETHTPAPCSDEHEA